MAKSKAPKKKITTRAELPPGDSLCDHCTARCCRYFAFPISKPKTWEDFDHMRWYLVHGNSAIFVDEGTWYILVYSDCQHLLPDNRCGIYETRPQICREYTTDDCEFDNDTGYDQFFESADQILEYANAILPPAKRAPWQIDMQKGLSLPVVS